MKKMIVASAFFLGAGAVLAADVTATAPTVYGKVNKEIKYIKQEDKFNTVKMLGPQDPTSSVSRLGAKGTVGTEGLKANYVLEMGLNSTGDNSSGTIALRQAYISAGDFWGSVIAGQTDTATWGIYTDIDPLQTTSAAMTTNQLSSTTDFQISNNSAPTSHQITGIGFLNRSRQDLVGYKSPNFQGLQFYTTWDKNNMNTNTVGTTNYTYWENLLTFEKKLALVTPKLYLGYVKQSGGMTLRKDTNLIGAVRVMVKDFVVGLSYSTRKNTTDTRSDINKKEKRMVATAKYTMGKLSAVATYAKAKVDNGLTNNDLDKANHTQCAASIAYNVYAPLELRLTYAKYKYEEDNNSQNEEHGNTAKVVIFGTQLTF
ncbi:MAG: porin [Pseudomonadota bacterium]